MKYYKNYILKRMTKEQYLQVQYVLIGHELLCFPYDDNSDFYYYRVDT